MNKFNLETLQAENSIFDVNVRKKNEKLFLPLSIEKTIKLIKKDSQFISENNEDFLQET